MSKRYLLQAIAANLGLVMRSLFGRGTPRGLAAAWRVCERAVSRVMAVREAAVGTLRALFRTFQPTRALPCAG